MQTVYVDVLVAVNLFIDYFLLLLTAKFLHLTVRRRRLLLGALTGAAFSLIILLPPLPPAADFLVKFVASLPAALVTFGFHGLRAFLKQVVSFFLLSFAFAGLLVAVWYFFAPAGLFVKNSIVYFDVPPLLLILLTLLSYFILRIFQRITGRGETAAAVCRVHLTLGGKSCVLQGRVDTGSSLKEPFSGLPVIVAEKAALPCLPQTAPRVVPFNSVGGEGMLKAWKPEKCELVTAAGSFCAPCWIACTETKLSGGEYQALVPPSLLDSAAENINLQNEKVGKERKHHAEKNSGMAQTPVCSAGALHKRTGNAAPSADESRGNTSL